MTNAEYYKDVLQDFVENAAEYQHYGINWNKESIKCPNSRSGCSTAQCLFYQPTRRGCAKDLGFLEWLYEESCR